MAPALPDDSAAIEARQDEVQVTSASLCHLSLHSLTPTLISEATRRTTESAILPNNETPRGRVTIRIPGRYHLSAP